MTTIQYEPYLSTMKKRVYSFGDLDEAKSFANRFYGTVTDKFIII